MTEAERKLWALLRRNQLGVKFRRQVPLGPYVVDFYCANAKLVVELDGSQHYTENGEQEDKERDAHLREMGQAVVRYSDVEFLQNEDGVVQDILERVKARIGGDSDPPVPLSGIPPASGILKSGIVPLGGGRGQAMVPGNRL
jgi:very-short-patch-repair endonuclease